VFIQDTIDLLSNKLQITPAFSYRRIKKRTTPIRERRVPEPPPEPAPWTTTSPRPTPNRCRAWPPASRRPIGCRSSAAVAKNFKSARNFDNQNLAKRRASPGQRRSNGDRHAAVDGQAGNSVNLDLGARYKGDCTVLGDGLLQQVKDRIASSYEPGRNMTHDFNVGDSTTKGLEIESRHRADQGLQRLRVADLYEEARSTTTCPTRRTLPATRPSSHGRQAVPDTPKGMARVVAAVRERSVPDQRRGKYTRAAS